MGNQYFAWGGIDFMVDPNAGDGGYLNYNEPNWDAVLAAQILLTGCRTPFPIYDDAREGTVAAGALSVFLGIQNSLLPSMSTIPTPIALSNCSTN
ncbi:uncharacterized protein PAC_13703 [Phialocephala subalpina]|uniref:Uncharacterized protein n=1 Tax=Phialocephala subalpina TaxID=576137 RepID=A0A1L7XFQ5_9HELO|nr:uncharacterized protein PAC_13703 [Phialocephala subalpina]